MRDPRDVREECRGRLLRRPSEVTCVLPGSLDAAGVGTGLGTVWGAERWTGQLVQLSQAEGRGRAGHVAPGHWLGRLLYARKRDLLSVTWDHMARAIFSL